MAITDTKLNSLILNVLTQDQYDNIETKSADELYLIKDVPNEKGIYYIEGNTTGTVGKWTGENPDIKEYYSGLIIAYKIGINGSSNGTTLNINGYGGLDVLRNNAIKVTSTTYAIGSVLILTCTKYNEEFVWKIADYANTDIYVKQTLKEENKNYPIIFSYNDIDKTSESVTNTVNFNREIYINPSTGTITALNFNGIATNAQGLIINEQPVSAEDIATKDYVDNLINGILNGES